MKWWIGQFMKLKAAAGPHELPPPGPDEAELGVLTYREPDEEDEFEEVTKSVGVSQLVPE